MLLCSAFVMVARTPATSIVPPLLKPISRSAPTPFSVSPLTSAFLTPDLLSRVVTYAFNGSTTGPTAAPACIHQTNPATFGFTGDYPHVAANTRLTPGALTKTPFSTGPAPPASVPGG